LATRKTPGFCWRWLPRLKATFQNSRGADPFETYFGDGYGKVVAVFFFHIEPSRPDVDEWLWVVVGDLPSAYLVIDACKTPSQALEGYIGEMSEWVKLAKEGRSSKDVIPVNAPATPESAGMLEARLKVLSERIVPALQANEAVPS